MATTFYLQVSCPAARAGVAQATLEGAHREIARLEDELSEFRPASPVHRLNQAAPGERVELTVDGAELLSRSRAIALRTRGAFDPTAKSQGARDGIGFEPRTRQAWRLHAGARLGFGAIGKGYALDLVRVILEREGFTDFLLSAGGSSQILSGFAAPGQPWRWGWSDASFTHQSGIPVALGVSGTEERGAHLIARGPHAAFPRSALVASPSAAEADALSTALFVGGWEESLQASRDEWMPPALAQIDADGTPRWNGTFQKLWGAIALLCLLPLGALADDGSVNLDAMDPAGAQTFTPYLFERNSWWALLPILTLVVVLAHLRRTKR